MAPGKVRLAEGGALVVGGGLLRLFGGDLELGWFDAHPLGVVLMVVGGVQLLEGAWRLRRGRESA
ncbi:hypothetical protein E1265_01380 [Streptomyces sp. 8K308]|uniref:DUF5708 family protein n=1 Tax=Streptomyces sp. 8K308 TaxID=2530388 RepID=UPI001046FC38|nr:DUF5708 family protein [Streptomyces sp. 8K308]TDC27571.1 hypothetical protein E1265_01380 [Streptomyces sp. 8K308]